MEAVLKCLSRKSPDARLLRVCADTHGRHVLVGGLSEGPSERGTTHLGSIGLLIQLLKATLQSASETPIYHQTV
eukprot:42583-Eustigmatos_ZCMA.PRE.1